MLKTLNRKRDFEEIKFRISKLKDKDSSKWGRMNAAQMLQHCSLVLEIPLGKTILPKKGILIKTIGIITKKEMKFFNNGIPPNMPTYDILCVKSICCFESARKNLYATMDGYYELYESGKLPRYHELFGKMNPKDWGFLEYKHLHHHLKQFGQ